MTSCVTWTVLSGVTSRSAGLRDEDMGHGVTISNTLSGPEWFTSVVCVCVCVWVWWREGGGGVGKRTVTLTSHDW